MKKILLITLTLIMILCLFACDKQNTYENILSQLDKYEFDAVTPYTEEEIAPIKNTLKSRELPYDVKNICHYFTKSVFANEENTWVYVYEFETNASAQQFKEKYADGWNIARIKDNVVVYGSFSGISNLDM